MPLNCAYDENGGGMKMRKSIVAVLVVSLSLALSLAAGIAGAGVAGTTTIGVAVEEMKAVSLGWSEKKQILDKDVYNDSNEKVGEVEDLIVTPDKAVSYVIIGVGGFLGLDRHDVAIPAGQLKVAGGKLTLPGATKDTLKALPQFEYTK
jgi:sporulation protein YlmC with PRC-barrel domain